MNSPRCNRGNIKKISYNAEGIESCLIRFFVPNDAFFYGGGLFFAPYDEVFYGKGQKKAVEVGKSDFNGDFSVA